MSVTDEIVRHLQALPECMQARVLDYVEYLESLEGRGRGVEEEADWRAFSLAQAMRGLEDEPSPYTEADIKEPVL